MKPLEIRYISSVTNETSQICSQNQHETSTEFMVTSTTMESVEDTHSKSVKKATENGIVDQSSTIIPCISHSDGTNASQPIIAVIPPAETSEFQTVTSPKTNMAPLQTSKSGRQIKVSKIYIYGNDN